MLKNSVPGTVWLCFRTGILSLSLVCHMVWAQGVSSKTTLQMAEPFHPVIDLSTAWRHSLSYDYRYQAAMSEQAAAQTERSQGRAGLLPHIQAGYVRSKVSGNARQPDFLGRVVGSELDYDSSSAYVQLQQPLLNYGRYANYRRGVALAEQGNAVFIVKQQETGIRLATAYFNVLLTHDELVLKRALATSLQQRAAVFEAHYLRQEGTRTEAQETQARLAIAQAEAIDAEDDLVVALRELRVFLGAAPTHMAALKDHLPSWTSTSENLSGWLDRARVGSTQVRSARQALVVANAEVERAASDYLPSMDLVVSYNKSDSENLSALSQRSNSFVIGVQISIPLFAGGYTRANVARAQLDRNSQQYKLNAIQEQNQAEVTRQYTLVRSGVERIAALEDAVASAQASLDAINMGFVLGTVGNLEVLKVQDTLYHAKYELIKARLEYLLARLKLAAAAGTLNSSLFDVINDTYLGRVISVEGYGFDDNMAVRSASLIDTR